MTLSIQHPIRVKTKMKTYLNNITFSFFIVKTEILGQNKIYNAI